MTFRLSRPLCVVGASLGAGSYPGCITLALTFVWLCWSCSSLEVRPPAGGAHNKCCSSVCRDNVVPVGSHQLLVAAPLPVLLTAPHLLDLLALSSSLILVLADMADGFSPVCGCKRVGVLCETLPSLFFCSLSRACSRVRSGVHSV